MNECIDCGDTRRIYTIKLVFTNRQDEHYPKYIPMVKELCFKCGRYIKFAKQTEELITRFNEKLEEIKLYERS